MALVSIKAGYAAKVIHVINDRVQMQINTDYLYESNYSICITGDSIQTEGAGLWSKTLRSTVKFRTYKNTAIGGTCLSVFGSGKEAISSDNRIADIPSDSNLIIIGGSTNDWGANVPVGSLQTLNDDKTFYGALAYIIETLNERNPDAKIILMSNSFAICPNRHNFYSADGVINAIGCSLEEYAEAMQEVADYYKIDYIPVYEECGINISNYQDFTLNEQNNYGDNVWVHPNSIGGDMIYRVVIQYLLEHGIIHEKTT